MDNAHHEASLVEVIDIVIQDPVFGLHIPYEVKPLPNSLLIFAFSSLVVVFAAITCTELWLAPDEVGGPVYPHGWRVAYA